MFKPSETGKKIVLYRCTVVDVGMRASRGDTSLVSPAIDEWLASDMGKWATANTKSPLTVQDYTDYAAGNMHISIIAELLPEDITYYKLRW